MRKTGRALAVVVLAVVLSSSLGCTYLVNRGNDALDIVELGVTVTTTPQIGLYWNSLDLLVAGYCDLDGTFIGWAGRHGVMLPVRSECYGLIVSREKVKWGDAPERERIGGLAGLPGIAAGAAEDGHPLDSPACVHFIPHFGYVGLVWNLRWGQIVDFVVGWTTVDLNGDDI
jgi:hypothetical protein